MRKSFVAFVIGALLASPAVVGIAHAITPPDSSLSLYSGDKKVTSSSGKTLHVAFEALQDVTSGTKTTSLRLYVGTSPLGEGSLGELHQFIFTLPNADLAFTASSGKVTVDTHSDISPYGTINMTFNPASSNTSCHAQDTAEVGTLSGAFHVDTNSNQWGTLGGNNFSFGSKQSSLFRYVDKGAGFCGGGGGGASPCSKGLSWFGPGSEQLSIFGSSSSAGSTMHFYRSVSLSTPAGATRVDSLDAKVSAPVLKSGKLTVHSGGPFSGVAAITNATKTPTGTYTCKKNGNKYTESTTTWYQADWSTPKSNRLTAHLQITPDWQAPLSDLNSSSYTKTTFA